MSVTTEAPSTVNADSADFAGWSLEDAISDLAAELGVGNAPADAPDDSPVDTTDQPTSDEGLAKPGDAMEADAESEQESEDSGDDDGEERVIPRTKAEEMRATAQRERDQARNELARLQEQLTQLQAQHQENEFMRGVLLRANQLLNENPNLSVNDANRQAWGEMSQRRDADRLQTQRLEVEAQTQQRVNDSVSLAAQQASENLYLLNVNAMQREATKMGVPTFDTQTAMDTLIMSERFERRVDAINAISNPELQKQAASDFYDDVKDAVRAQMQKVADAAKAKKPAIAARQQAQNAQTPIAATTPAEFANLDIEAMIERTFAPDAYRQELEAHPSLTIRR